MNRSVLTSNAFAVANADVASSLQVASVRTDATCSLCLFVVQSKQALNLLVQIRFPALSLQASHMAVHMPTRKAWNCLCKQRIVPATILLVRVFRPKTQQRTFAI